MTGRNDLVEDFATLWFAAPFVIAARMTKLSQAALGSATVEAETARMVAEKTAAAWESTLALQFGLMSEMMRAGSARSGRSRGKAVERLAAKGVRPYAKRVRANARRLER